VKKAEVYFPPAGTLCGFTRPISNTSVSPKRHAASIFELARSRSRTRMSISSKHKKRPDQAKKYCPCIDMKTTCASKA
jgi:hypothetical protein